MENQKFVIIKDMSAGNDSIGDMWQETKIFMADATLKDVAEWAFDFYDRDGIEFFGPSKKRITITIPDNINQL